MNREEANKDELIFIKGVGYFHPDILGIKMGDTGKCVEKDNNVPCKPSDRCGCGGVTEQTDFHDGFFPYSKVECLECGIEIMRAGNIIAEAHSEAKGAWNTSRGYTAPHLPGAIGPKRRE